jgi:hypothetical protein
MAHPRSQLPGAGEIDARYGLEPVFEPGAGGNEPTQFITLRCPYCGEQYDTAVDLSAGSFTHIEDCQVCCRPIELTVRVTEDGAINEVTAAAL